MNYKNTYEGIDPELVKKIKGIARKGMRNQGFTESDLPDLEQELILAVLKAQNSYKPEMESEGAFMNAVVSRRMSSICRWRRAKKRDWRKCRDSLNRQILTVGEDEACFEFIDFVSSDGQIGPCCAEIMRPDMKFNVSLDIESALQRLPEKLRLFCEDLKYMNTYEAAKRHNIPKNKISGYLSEIREMMRCFDLEGSI